MELNSSVNTFIGGMNLDSDISLLKENQYTYAENIRLLANEDSTTGVLQNRDCLSKIESFITGTILGTVVTRLYNKDNGKSDEVIVVITLDSNLNNIYIINTTDYSSKIIIDKQPLGWNSKLKIVANYESDTVSKIYIADGINPIRVVDITKTYSIVKSTDFELVPIVNMYKPELVKIISGQLLVGAIQYAYQLFSKHGFETPVSTVSGIINIPKISANTSKDVYGGNKNEVSDIGIRIKAEFSEIGNLNMFRLYRIRYSSNNDIPEIFVVTEFEIDSNSVIYDDVTDSFISLITVDEFNMLTLTEFIPATIEKHENYLFAANIKEKAWDIEYDARAYRCDKYGNIKLEHSDQTKTIEGTLNFDGKINGKNVPLKHDCINPSNNILHGEGSDTYLYGYKDGKIVLGGTGPNVSYEFCFTDVICSDNKTEFTDSNVKVPASDLQLNCKTTKNTIKIVDCDNNVLMEKQQYNDNGILPNYSDSWFTSNFLGYHRDEIYRFGIVFYNKKNQKSSVHWIGDIKIPHSNICNTTDSNFYPFKFGDTELTGNAIGIKFNVNIPEKLKKEISSWCIVRCNRTETDRTILMQCALGGIIPFDSWGDTGIGYDLGDSDIRPTSILNWNTEYNTWVFSNYYFYDHLKKHLQLVSPEICVNKNSLVDNLKNSNICLQNVYRSRFKNEFWEEPSAIQIATQQFRINPLFKTDQYYRSSSGTGYQVFNENRKGVTLGPHIAEFFGEAGSAMIFKYYIPVTLDGVETSKCWNGIHKINNCIVSEPLPLQWENTDAKKYAIPFGNKIYINTSVGSKWILNNHGICAVVDTDSPDFNFGECNDNNNYGDIAIANIKQPSTNYGGVAYVNRINSTYISCTQHVKDENTVCVFGGDTYLGIFDYTNTMFHQISNDPQKDAYTSIYVGCYIPMESSVNINLFNDKTYSKTVSNINDSNNQTAQNLIQYEPFVSPNYTQTKYLYEYNSVYSADTNAQIHVPDLLYTDDNPIFETRIISSELKTNNEIIDSWTKFKFANYLDVDNQYGHVTNLKSINGKLFFWQDSAVGVASVNERSLIQDNNIAQLTLGTGGILTRYDYHTTLNGSSIPNDRSICNSSSTLYWYDTDKHEICAINNTVIELGKVKGVKSWCNKLLGRSETLGWYDWKYNEVLFLNKSEDVKRSIVFNELLNTFTGFYTYPASHVALMVDKLVTLDDMGNIYTHDSDVNYEPFESKITYVVNKGYPETKVFDNVWFDAEFVNTNVLNYVQFKTKTLETNLMCYCDILNREDTYMFPIPRDKNGVARMRGKYLICDYTFDCTNDGDFKIPYIKTTFRISRV